MKIAVIGGGPAGLYFARLMKRRDSSHDIVVVEQNPPDATYGFGVALGSVARERIRDADPDIHRRLDAAMIFEHRQLIRLNDAAFEVAYATAGGAIARLELLRILRKGCESAGVRLRHGRRVESLAEFEDFDLIVGADGANSIVRTSLKDEFGTRSASLENFMAWYGVGKFLAPNGLAFRRAADGYFVGHYYAYTNSMSTFVPECDAETWRSSGLGEMSEPQRRAYVERVFAHELGGARLIDNNSIFRNPQVITNERWTSRNAVLIGDALRNAHPSIGSGTRMAMDDAFELFAALADSGNRVAEGLALFIARRKPARARFEDAMERSYRWYGKLRTVMNQPLMDFVYDFLTRTGRVDDARLKSYAPGFYESYRAYKSSSEGQPSRAK